MSLWKAVKTPDEKDSTTNLPLQGASYLISNNENLIDIVNDYTWTISPKSGRGDVPYVHLIEKRVTNNVLLQQAIYNVRALAELGDVSVEQYTKMLQTASGLSDEELQKILEEKKNADVSNKNTSSEKDGKESPYKGLYDLEETGWQYVFPYFDTNNKNIGGKWGDTNRGIVGNFAAKLAESIEDTSSIVNTVQAALGAGTGLAQAPIGTYIEKPKQYEYGQTQETYTVTFKLYNTHNYADIIKNWEFCFLLIYQNLPNRRTKTIIDPPVLYEFLIPGLKHCPLAYIQSLKIDFVGATRVMNLVVGGDDRGIETIVPDAYKITIALTDIFPESRNFMEGILDETKRITVSSKNGKFKPRKSEFLFDVTQNNNTNVFNKIGDTVSNAANTVRNAVSGIFGGG